MASKPGKTTEQIDLEQSAPQTTSADLLPATELAVLSLLRRCRFAWLYMLVFNIVAQLIEPRVNLLPGWWLFWTLNLIICAVRIWLARSMSQPGGLTARNIRLWGCLAPLHALLLSFAVSDWYWTFGFDAKGLLATLIASGMTISNLVNYRPNLRIMRRVLLGYQLPLILTALWIGGPAGWAVGLHLMAILAFCLYQGKVENLEFWQTLHAMRDVKIATQRVEKAAQVHAELMASRTRQTILAAERSRIAAEWHDTLLAGFSAISWQIDIAENDLPPEAAKSAKALHLARTMLKHYREEARSVIADLQILPDYGDFDSALSQVLQPLVGDRPVRLELNVTAHNPSLPSQAKYHLIRICQEAVSNAVQHALPKSIQVNIAETRGIVTAEIQDDGAGFALGEFRPGHYGLEIMKERANRMGGRFEVSSAPGLGTTVLVRVPTAGNVVTRTRIMIVESQNGSHSPLRALLQSRPDLAIVAIASKGAAAIESFREHLPDVTMVDARLPDMNGIEVRTAIHEVDPFARVLVLSNTDDARQLLQAIDTVLEEHPVTPELAAPALSAPFSHDELTPRERDVLEQLVQGLNDRDIATRLGIGEKTVRLDTEQIVSKLGASDRNTAVEIALRRGVVDQPANFNPILRSNSNAIL